MDKEKASKRELTLSDSDEDEELVLEEESESEPEVDCEKWDCDCKTISIEPANSLLGYHLMPTCSRDPDGSSPKKVKIAPEVRQSLLDGSFKAQVQDVWYKNKQYEKPGLEVIVNPFKVCVINDFLENPTFLNEVRQEFNEIDWNLRSMDLYEFSQSKDLQHLSQYPCITSIYKLLQDDVKKWVADITGSKLTHISATCSLYNCTDYLLVHDDQREDRKIAFILYLTGPDGWNDSKGGALELLDKDEDGHPSGVARSVFPANNQLIFFPVTNDSFHQVAEVTSYNDSRLSINGWFHTEVPPVYTTPNFKPYPEGLYADKSYPPIDFDSDLSAWISDSYLDDDTIDEIQEYFEDHSEISLKNFLREELLEELLAIIKSDNLSWVKIGPPNRYCYEVAQNHNLPVVLDRFFKLFQSKQMFTLIQSFTGLEFKKDVSSMKFELQRWTPGCYSLLGDYDWYDKKQLDLVLYFDCKNISDVIGGRTLYVTTDEQVQDALITLEPEENNLNLIYRDTARFTKYFSKLSQCQCFYTLICSYTE